MVKIAGSDIPNLSKIVEDTFNSIGDIYCRDEFDSVDNDIGMNMDLENYTSDNV